MQTEYAIVEIFESLQGEGFNTGMPAIFIRFGKCNLACPWCDTDYQTFSLMTLQQIADQVTAFSTKNIIITGGEPTIQPNLEKLLSYFKTLGYFLAIETNGLKPVPSQIDYIATSPKRLYRHKYQQRGITHADEVRIVNDDKNIQLFCQEIAKKIEAKHYYLSPCEQQGEMNLLDTIRKLGQLNENTDIKWQLSIQTHKLVGIE
ncbi:7-carboxy-7-deazaguanine synthase QueE [Gallibacterium anatis]|uniref:7-carboxy-7-deazaguanine synthase QueE n=1 Tax=Gallibacterium anatis TaxID=750 RepID=UPI00254FCBF4|nr:7-carboxy-7-deazaguanine synthase QueE [Gallibacterium anatis]MDK9559919.1 7-carboxy-7-deazaguanine synthase QueE [Gallibacterium anatis]